MDSYVVDGWCNVDRTRTIVPVIHAIVKDYRENCFEEERDWKHTWEYIKIIASELGFESYLVEPLIRNIVDTMGQQVYSVGVNDREQVETLRKLVLPEQRTPEWFAFRQTRLTASELSYCVSQPLHSSISQKIILQKICPEAVPYISSAATSHGTLYEPIAQMMYERIHGKQLFEFGCIPHADVDWLAASPDGITEDGVMVEIKCPYSRTPKGVPSMNYYTQIQAQLEVCDFQLCDFMECEIEMYESREAYIRDTAEKSQETKHTLQTKPLYRGMKREYLPKQSSGIIKGASITIERRGPAKSECMSWTDLSSVSSKQWISEKLTKAGNDMVGYNVQYWIVKRIWITRIARNANWFQSLLPSARRFWDEVLRKKTEEITIPVQQKSMSFVEETI